MRFEKKRVSYWIPLAILIVLISLILVYCQSQENMNVYQTEPSESMDLTSTTNNEFDDIELELHQNSTLNISYGIPDDWVKVNMNGHETYVHRPSSSSAQIQIMDYSPIYVTATESIVRAELENTGLLFQSFQWTSNSSYTVIYQKKEPGTVYVEMFSFDKVHAVRLLLSWPTEYYDQMLNKILAIADSFKWEKESPYPENVSLVYHSTAAFEFGYPTGWQTAINGNVYLAQDPESKTLMTMTVNESSTLYNGLSQLDYINWASAGRSKFALQSFDMDQNTVYSMSTFSTNNTNMVLIHYMYASGKFEYIITFEIPYNVYESKAELVSTLINLLKIY